MRHTIYAQVKILHKKTYIPNFWNKNKWKCFLETSYAAVLKHILHLHRKLEFFTFQILRAEKNHRDTVITSSQKTSRN